MERRKSFPQPLDQSHVFFQSPAPNLPGRAAIQSMARAGPNFQDLSDFFNPRPDNAPVSWLAVGMNSGRATSSDEFALDQDFFHLGKFM